jgi:hypothetical protein
MQLRRIIGYLQKLLLKELECLLRLLQIYIYLKARYKAKVNKSVCG